MIYHSLLYYLLTSIRVPVVKFVLNGKTALLILLCLEVLSEPGPVVKARRPNDYYYGEDEDGERFSCYHECEGSHEQRNHCKRRDRTGRCAEFLEDCGHIYRAKIDHCTRQNPYPQVEGTASSSRVSTFGSHCNVTYTCAEGTGFNYTTSNGSVSFRKSVTVLSEVYCVAGVKITPPPPCEPLPVPTTTTTSTTALSSSLGSSDSSPTSTSTSSLSTSKASLRTASSSKVTSTTRTNAISTSITAEKVTRRKVTTPTDKNGGLSASEREPSSSLDAKTAYILIGVCVVFCLVVLGLCLFCCWKRNQNNNNSPCCVLSCFNSPRVRGGGNETNGVINCGYTATEPTGNQQPVIRPRENNTSGSPEPRIQEQLTRGENSPPFSL